MTRWVALVTTAAALLLVGGCSQVQRTATDAASSAVSQVAKASADEVRRQICALVQDSQLSAQNKQLLAGLLPTAQAAGLPSQITTPLAEIAQSGDQTPAQSVASLRQACTATTTSP